MGVCVGDAPNATNYSFQEFLELWFYGGTFHSNPEREAQLSSMPYLAPEILTMLVQSRLPSALEILRLIAEVIRIWLEDPSAQIPDPPTA